MWSKSDIYSPDTQDTDAIDFKHARTEEALRAISQFRNSLHLSKDAVKGLIERYHSDVTCGGVTIMSLICQH